MTLKDTGPYFELVLSEEYYRSHIENEACLFYNLMSHILRTERCKISKCCTHWKYLPLLLLFMPVAVVVILFICCMSFKEWFCERKGTISTIFRYQVVKSCTFLNSKRLFFKCVVFGTRTFKQITTVTCVWLL